MYFLLHFQLKQLRTSKSKHFQKVVLSTHFRILNRLVNYYSQLNRFSWHFLACEIQYEYLLKLVIYLYMARIILFLGGQKT